MPHDHTELKNNTISHQASVFWDGLEVVLWAKERLHREETEGIQDEFSLWTKEKSIELEKYKTLLKLKK